MSLAAPFDSDWYRGMSELAARCWSPDDAAELAAGRGAASSAVDAVERAWQAARDAELPGVAVPAEFGGTGLAPPAVLEIVTAAGAALFPARLAFEALYPALVLRALPPSPAAGELLAAIAAGERVAVILAGPGAPSFVHGAASAGYRLVLGETAVTACRVSPAVADGAARGADGAVALAVLDGREIGLPGDVGRAGHRLLDGAVAARVREQARWLGALFAAADGLGAGWTPLRRAIDYAGTRHQFGVPIGSFQAVKHALVNRYLDLELGRALLTAAADTIGAALPNTASADSGTDADAGVAAAMAKAALNEAAVAAVNTAIQVHGAIGFTAELGLHLYQRRALVDRELFAGTGRCLRVVRGSLGLAHVADPPQPDHRTTGAPA